MITCITRGDPALLNKLSIAAGVAAVVAIVAITVFAALAYREVLPWQYIAIPSVLSSVLLMETFVARRALNSKKPQSIVIDANPKVVTGANPDVAVIPDAKTEVVVSPLKEEKTSEVGKIAFPHKIVSLQAYHAAKLGDTAGYGNAHIEQERSTQVILQEFGAKKGEIEILERLKKAHNFIFSDDTVFLELTTMALADATLESKSKMEIFEHFGTQYLTYKEIDTIHSQRGHGPGIISALRDLKPQDIKKVEPKFNPRAAGSGSAMRAMPIGEVFYKDKKRLCEVAFYSSIVTHTNPMGFLGGVTSALLTSYAKTNVPLKQWSTQLLEDMQLVKPYMDEVFKGDKSVESEWNNFMAVWKGYGAMRELYDKNSSDALFAPMKSQDFGPELNWREWLGLQVAFCNDNRGYVHLNEPGKYRQMGAPYKIEENDWCWSMGMSIWPGASGHDAPLIALEALRLTIERFNKRHNLSIQTPEQFASAYQKLNEQEKEAVLRDLTELACLHGGDSDSTGVIAFYLCSICLGDQALVPPAIEQNLEKSLLFTF